MNGDVFNFFTKSWDMLKFIIIVCHCLCLFFLQSTIGLADVLISTNGDKLIGTLLGFDKSYCTYGHSMSAEPLITPWTKIKSLKTDTPYKIIMSGGDQLTGVIDYSAKKGFKISSNYSRASINLSLLQKAYPLEQQVVDSKVKPVNPANVQSSKDELSNNNRINSEPPEFGEEEENSPMTFLRGTSVLLEPGQVETRITFGYSPRKQVSYGTKQERLFYTSLGINAGLHRRVEGWLNIPFGYVQAHEDSIFHSNIRQSHAGLMDISFGFTGLLLTETDERPELSVSVRASAPTGQEPYDVNKIYSLGSGHWSAGLGLNFVKSADPAVVFWGLSATHYWPHHKYERKFSYDDLGLDYYLGIGVAYNERLSFSTRFNGAYQPALKADGDKSGVFSSDPMWVSFSAAYRLDSMLVLEPQITFGLNSDAGDPQFSVAVSKKFY